MGNVTNAGLITVGDAVTTGTLTITGNYVQTAAGGLTIRIGGYTAGNLFDRLAVGGTATLDGMLTVTLVGGFTPLSEDSFGVLTWASETGTFATLAGDGDLFSPTYGSSSLTLVAN
jgi:hypothetical protein